VKCPNRLWIAAPVATVFKQIVPVPIPSVVPVVVWNPDLPDDVHAQQVEQVHDRAGQPQRIPGDLAPLLVPVLVLLSVERARLVQQLLPRLPELLEEVLHRRVVRQPADAPGVPQQVPVVRLQPAQVLFQSVLGEDLAQRSLRRQRPPQRRPHLHRVEVFCADHQLVPVGVVRPPWSPAVVAALDRRVHHGDLAVGRRSRGGLVPVPGHVLHVHQALRVAGVVGRLGGLAVRPVCAGRAGRRPCCTCGNLPGGAVSGRLSGCPGGFRGLRLLPIVSWREYTAWQQNFGGSSRWSEDVHEVDAFRRISASVSSSSTTASPAGSSDRATDPSGRSIRSASP